MSSFGQSHRTLVQDTNAGQIVPDQATKQSARVSPGTPTQVGPQHAAAQALIDVGKTVAAPALDEKKRRDERDAYTNAGKEEGRQSADAAADVWHNKLFGPNASLQAAQTRIAEDNARNVYLQAQDLLENGGADSWDDEQWEEWRDTTIEDEVNKYDSEDMKNHINSSLAQDFQKLERDRGYLHNQYNQAESRNTALNSLNTIAKTYNTDRGSSNPNRSEADSIERLEEINKLKESSGMSDKAFSSAVAQIAGEEYAKGRDDFGTWAGENGYFDDLDFEVQEQLTAAQRIHEIKHDEALGERSNELFGPQGYIAQGNTNKALEAYDALVAEYPELIPQGGRNQIRNEVQQQAFVNAERARVQQERISMGKENARTGNWTPQVIHNPDGTIEYRAYGEHEIIGLTQMALAEDLENKYHANQLRDDPNYEKTPLSAVDRQNLYADNPQMVGQAMQRSGVMLPEVRALTSHAMGSINHNLETMDEFEADALRNQLNAIDAMSHGNPAVRKMMNESLGADSGVMEHVQQGLNVGKKPAELSRSLKDMYQEGTPGTNSKAAAGRGIAPEHELSRKEEKEILSRVREDLGEGGFLMFNKLTETDTLANEIKEEFAKQMVGKNPNSRSARDIGLSNTANNIKGRSAILKTGNGKEYLPGAGQFEQELQARGYSDINDFMDELNNNEAFMESVREESGVALTTWLPWKNSLLSDGATIESLDDGTVELIIPRESGGAYTRAISLPGEKEIPEKMIRHGERVSEAMTYIDSPQWNETTGRDTPREELDASLDKRYLQLNYPLIMDASSKIDVTQEQRDSILSPDKYDEVLRQRQEVAAEKEAKRIGRREWLNRP